MPKAETQMSRYTGYVAFVLFGILIGYFAGREHLKYEMRSALATAATGISESLSSAFGRTTDADEEQQKVGTDGKQVQTHEDLEAAAYIADSLELYDVSVEYKESMLDGRVPGVLFKIRNNGERSLDKVEVTIFFKDEGGLVIAEEDYHPVLVSEYSFSGSSKPLKPGYIWQMEQGKFYSAKNVPSEWKEGSVEASITDIRFTE